LYPENKRQLRRLDAIWRLLRACLEPGVTRLKDLNAVEIFHGGQQLNFKVVCRS
jgi:hypothetical protein